MSDKKKKITCFKDLFAWQEGHKLVLTVYALTNKIPDHEKFGLTSRLRRASVSITLCIAEGFSRRGPKEKLQFYKIALGSLTEVENQLLIAKDIKYITNNEYQRADAQLVHVRKLLIGLIKSARTQQ